MSDAAQHDEAVMTRAYYRHFLKIPTRWMDNDIYGHVNNVVYYSFFDTVINEYLIRNGGLNIHDGAVVGFAVETQCRFHQSLCFPETIDAGMRVARLGNSSVRYEIGLFKESQDRAAATGHFVHVFVDRASNRPTSLPDGIRNALNALA